jgi:hypothetical protein
MDLLRSGQGLRAQTLALFKMEKMDRLLARIAEADEEDDVVVRFINATWSDRSLRLQLAVTIFDSPQEIWEVRCEDVSHTSYATRPHVGLN